MPKSLKQWYFPTRPDVWTEGDMSVEDFKTQYMLEFVDGAGQFLSTEERDKLINGDFEWLHHGRIGEKYVAGIDFAGSSSDNADFTHITVLRIDRSNQKQKVYAEEMQAQYNTPVLKGAGAAVNNQSNPQPARSQESSFSLLQTVEKMLGY
jgi:hypothetical protein